MISLFRPLKSTLNISGQEFKIKTDFRIWLALIFGEYSPIDIFEDKIPADIKEASKAMTDFINGSSENKGEAESERSIDFIVDADFIYGAFLQAYKIDLNAIAYLHYHQFIALLKAIPESTTLSQIIGYRLYNGDDKELLKLKDKWRLPRILSEEEERLKAEFEEVWG